MPQGIETRKLCSRGCPQGSVLGPLLWNTVLDDFLNGELSEDVEYIAYADDIAIVAKSNSKADVKRKIQDAVDGLSAWARRQKLMLSTAKSKVLINRGLNKCHNRDFKIKLGNGVLEVLKNFKYLGVVIDDKQTFMSHVTSVCDRVRKVLYGLRFFIKTN